MKSIINTSFMTETVQMKIESVAVVSCPNNLIRFSLLQSVDESHPGIQWHVLSVQVPLPLQSLLIWHLNSRKEYILILFAYSEGIVRIYLNNPHSSPNLHCIDMFQIHHKFPSIGNLQLLSIWNLKKGGYKFSSKDIHNEYQKKSWIRFLLEKV